MNYYTVQQNEWLEETGVKVGSFVKVVRSAIRTIDDFKIGWCDTWVKEMDYFVGNIYKVIRIQEENGLRLENAYYGDFNFPYFCVEALYNQKKIPYASAGEALADAGRIITLKSDENVKKIISRVSYSSNSFILSDKSELNFDEANSKWKLLSGGSIGKSRRANA